MGKDKLLLELAGKTLIDRVLATLSAIFPEVILVGRALPGLEKRVEIFPDFAPGLGPISELALEFERRKVLTAPVKAGYFLLVVLSPEGRPSVVRAGMDAARERLASEVA